MAQPDMYSDGEKMKGLRRRHDENQEQHAQAMKRWEEVDQAARRARAQHAVMRAGDGARSDPSSL